MLVEFAPGVAFPRHSHPGEEIVYVTEGSLVYEVEGRPPVTLAAYVVEKGKPLITLDQQEGENK